MEIYNEEIRDLLGKDRDKSLEVKSYFFLIGKCFILNKFKIKERPNVGVYADGLSAHACHSATGMEALMRSGSYNRKNFSSIDSIMYFFYFRSYGSNSHEWT